MNHLLLQVLSLVAFAALALATDRTQSSVFGRRLARGPRRGLRLAGWSVLLLALVAAVGSQGWALGLVSLSGHTSLAAGLVLCGLILHDRRKAERKSAAHRPAR